jgi:hypothetical protein
MKDVDQGDPFKEPDSTPQDTGANQQAEQFLKPDLSPVTSEVIENKIASRWEYAGETGERDLRIDFLRGMVMCVLLVVHLNTFSWYNLLAWERFGVIAGAEGFVILSGIVLGMVFKRKAEQNGMQFTAFKFLDRSAQLYRVSVFIICAVWLLSLLPFINTFSFMNYVDEHTGEVFPQYPGAEASIWTKISMLLLLKAGPHHTQILGLYTILLVFAPVALWLLRAGKTGLLLGLSWIVYFAYLGSPAMPTGAQFEYAFPVLAWQVLFFHGMAIGFHRKKIAEIMHGKWRVPILATAWILFLGFLFFTQNNPNPAMPSWAKLYFIQPDTFNYLYNEYFAKDKLKILRIVNYAAALIVAYYLLTRYWGLVAKNLGKVFIPLGQASLYVFIMHVFVILAINSFGLDKVTNPWINTLVHSVAIIALWLMVKKQFLFKWVPR